MPPEPVLIAALSGRALAASARRAGWAPIVLDAFDDLDTQACALASAHACVSRSSNASRTIGAQPARALASERVPIDESWSFEEARLLEAAGRRAPPPMPLVWGSGFERAPGLLERLAQGRTLYGNDATTAALVKDPFAFARRLADLGVAHPEVRRTPPEDPENWLVKRVGGAGGAHIRPATAHAPAGEDHYYQRRVCGRAISALVLSDGVRATTLSFSEQWADPAPDGRAFRFSGCAVPAMFGSNVTPTPTLPRRGGGRGSLTEEGHALPRRAEKSRAGQDHALPPCGGGMGGGYAELGARLACAAEAVVGSYALRGVASVDFLVDRDQFHVLEVNPRPGASLDAYDLVHRVSLFERHVRACQGNLGKSLSPPTRAAASAIVYTRSRLIVPYGMDWPVWSADRGEDGTVLFPGHPVCTVFADGVDAIEARRRALDRAEEMLERLERGTAAIHATWAAAREASASART